jgi:cell wall-active antibiotic response 4TMS protein YvqF
VSHYVMIRRLRGPAFLLLVGLIALLHQMGLIHNFWHLFWPLLLIQLGVFMLAERAAMAAEAGYPPAPYPGSYGGQPYPGAPYAGAVDPNAAPGASQYSAPQGTAIVPASPHDLVNNPEGGQS